MQAVRESLILATIRPFRALRPDPRVAAAVASVPYDVVTADEARALAADNPLSFLHVSRAEIDLPASANPYDDAVYRRAAENLETLKRLAPFVVDDEPLLYLYRLRSGDHMQTGLAGCFSLEEYDRNVIRRHERTRRDKEDDRTRHMLAVGAQTGIAFLAYRAAASIDALVERATTDQPLVDLATSDDVHHTIWRLGPEAASAAVDAFAEVPAVYIADGHHRIASAARAHDALTPKAVGDPAGNPHLFLGVAFPDRETRILAYNRTVTTLAGRTPAQFLDAVRARFPVTPDASATPPKGQVAMYLDRRWSAIDLGPARFAANATSPTARLDVALLHDQVFAPLLDVADVRTDPRIAFVGGVRGTAALERAVDTGAAAVAFSLAPVTPAELLAVSDAGDVMPPKSTWFEPKLRDGLLIHEIAPPQPGPWILDPGH